ncbi:MAG: SIMPL domain-containing protein [Bacteroidales bacterium]|nr:SIMPL domain-containing protein [Bacteroidales bacterium]
MNRISNWAFVCLSASIVILGAFIYAGIAGFKDSDRIVTVKGLSSREVPADKVIWPLVFKGASNSLSELTAVNERNTKAIIDFLTAGGIDSNDITISPVKVNDALSELYQSDRVTFRYKSTSVITVATSKVDEVRKLLSRQSELVSKGIVLSGENYEYPLIFSFNGLNDIKPEMVAQATKNARATAEKFAQDSDSRLGKIRNASQGQFSIEDRDSNTPHIKIVRVVTTITYQLAD